MTSKDDPRVVVLLAQLQAQHANIGKIPAAIGYANISYLRSELYAFGWNSRLKNDGVTVELFEREGATHES